MSFLARLFINDRIINVQSSRIHFSQNKDIAGKPAGRVNGGLFTLVLEMDGQTDLLHQMMAIEQMVDGYVRFYKRDGMSKLVDYEFKDTYIYRYRMTQTANGTNPALIEVSFSPGILLIGSVQYIKPWHVTDIHAVEAAPTPEAPSNSNPRLLSTHYTDQEGDRVEELYEGTLILVVESRDCTGEYVDIDLSDDQFDFKYKGQRAEDDILRDVKITQAIQEIPLEVILEAH